MSSSLHASASTLAVVGLKQSAHWLTGACMEVALPKISSKSGRPIYAFVIPLGKGLNQESSDIITGAPLPQL